MKIISDIQCQLYQNVQNFYRTLEPAFSSYFSLIKYATNEQCRMAVEQAPY